MSTKTVFECDNIFSDANPHGEVHGKYHYPELLPETCAPEQDRWFAASVVAGILGVRKMELNKRCMGEPEQKHFCCWDCMISWAKREMNPKEGE